MDSCEISRKGIHGDRQWLIVDSEGNALTQRKYPIMACIQPRPTDDGLVLQKKNGSSVVSEIRVIRPHADAPRTSAKVWKDTAEGLICATEANQWLTEAIGAHHPLKLLYYSAESRRLPGYPDRFGADATHFADAAPFLVVNAFSLRALNLMLENKCLPLVDIRHFRPNIVFSGLPGFAEQHAVSLKKRNETLKLKLVDLCQRCAVITVDPHTGTRLPKAVPFAELAALNPMPENPKAPGFGMNAMLESPDQTGNIAVGDIWEMSFKN